MCGLEESMERVVQVMKEEGPIDGFIAFSQGSILFRHFYRVLDQIDPKYRLYHGLTLPNFFIAFGGPYFPKMPFEYKGHQYSQDIYRLPLDSVHIYGKRDEYLRFMNAHVLFDNDPLVIYHEEGHKFPRAISDEDYAKLSDFVKRQFVAKYGDEEGFTLPYEHY